MNEAARMQVPKIGEKVTEGDMYLIQFDVTCPICLGKWIMTFREQITAMSKIQGAVAGFVRENKEGAKSIRIDTAGWGAHALCGTCYARRIAVIATGTKVNFAPWNEKDDQVMWGRLKNQQNKYHAWATPLRKATGAEALLDEQQSRRVEILGRQNTLISPERLKMLGLEEWEWKTAT